MINFDCLTKKTAHIGVGNGSYIEVPLLTVADFAEFSGIVNELTAQKEKNAGESENLRVLQDTRAKVIAIVKRVMPVETWEGLERMPLEQLFQLANVLCTGNDESTADDPEKKITFQSQITATT